MEVDHCILALETRPTLAPTSQPSENLLRRVYLGVSRRFVVAMGSTKAWL